MSGLTTCVLRMILFGAGIYLFAGGSGLLCCAGTPNIVPLNIGTGEKGGSGFGTGGNFTLLGRISVTAFIIGFNLFCALVAKGHRNNSNSATILDIKLNKMLFSSITPLIISMSTAKLANKNIKNK